MEDTDTQLSIMKQLSYDQQFRLASLLSDEVQEYYRTAARYLLVDSILEGADDTIKSKVPVESLRVATIRGSTNEINLEAAPRAVLIAYGLLPEDTPRITPEDAKACLDAYMAEPDWKRNDAFHYMCDYLSQITPYDRSYGCGVYLADFFLDDTGERLVHVDWGMLTVMENGVEKQVWSIWDA